MCASDEARHMGHTYIGTEHLLLGVVLVDGEAAKLLLALPTALAADTCRQFIAQTASPGLSPSQLPMTPQLKKVLDLSDKVAVAQHHNYISDQHILIALLEADGGRAQELLHKLGTDFEKLGQAALDSLNSRSNA